MNWVLNYWESLQVSQRQDWDWCHCSESCTLPPDLPRTLRPCDHMMPTFWKLHWLPVLQRIEFELCLLIHKIQLGHLPRYLGDLLTFAADMHGRPSVQSSSCSDFIVPHTSCNFGDSFLCYCSPNRLPVELKTLAFHTTVQVQSENIFYLLQSSRTESKLNWYVMRLWLVGCRCRRHIRNTVCTGIVLFVLGPPAIPRNNSGPCSENFWKWLRSDLAYSIHEL